MSQSRARKQRQDATSAKGTAPSRHRKPLAIGAAAIVVAAIVVAGVLAARGTGPAEATAGAPSDAVRFSGTDPVTGKTVDVADYAGKPVVLNVWGSWCEGCNAEAADLRAFVDRHREIQMIGIDVQDTKGGARSFYRRWGWKHPSISDGNGSIASALGLQGTPTTYFLDRNHQIVAQIVGATDLAGFERGLQTALSGT